MTTVAYRARALGPLRVIDWAIPPGVSVVVGPNRVGKSTLLRLPTLITGVLTIGLHGAFKRVFEGMPQRNLAIPSSTPMTLGLAGHGVEWELDLTVQGGQIASLPSERLLVDGEVVLWRNFGSAEIESKDGRFPWPKGVLPLLAVSQSMNLDGVSKALAQAVFPQFSQPLPADAPAALLQAARRMSPMLLGATPVYSYATYHYQIDQLLRFGSLESPAITLQRDGTNLFPLLRNWRVTFEFEERFEFVLATMREIFPHLDRIGFDAAGRTVTMEVSDQRWADDSTILIAHESTGFITALLQLCALVSCPRGGRVTLDEIETSLHPRAIRVLVEACRTWAAKHDIRVVLATQSETVLDQFRDEPSQVFVLEPQQETSPRALTELFSPEYLSQFSLGDLFAHLEFGSDPTHDQA